jgi:hypothetical protein
MLQAVWGVFVDAEVSKQFFLLAVFAKLHKKWGHP